MRFNLFNVVLIASILLGSKAIAQRPSFDKSKDLLIAQFDSKPDPDDIHAQAALGSMLAHSDLAGVNAYGVAGAYGMQNGQFIDSDQLFDMVFGNSNWTDADADRNGSVTRITNKVIPILNNGGKVWVQEAGQSNITRDWLIEVQKSVNNTIVKNNVIVVQHSEWNQNLADNTSNTPAANPVVLNFVRNNTTYFYIDDGNAPFGGFGDHGPWETPEYRSRDQKWLNQALSSPNAKAKQLWTEAERVIAIRYPNGVPYDWSFMKNGGTDFSDCVENWWIFNIGSNADSVDKFWSRYITNTDGTVDNCTINLSAINDFTNTTIAGFSPAYVDNVRNALAIDASQYKDQFAAAESTFTGTTGTYDIKLTTLTEIDGESTYNVFVDGTQIGTYTNPTTTTDYAPAGTTFKDITISNGAVIRVTFNSHTNGAIPEGNSTAYSRGRWTALDFTCSTDNPGGENCNADFEEKNGIVVIEAENLNNISSTSWNAKTEVAGFTGTSYISWDGNDSFNTPGNGIITAKIQVNDPGEYRFQWRSKVGKGNSSTEHNDSWLRFPDASSFFARKGTNVIYPLGSGQTPNPAGAGGDGWFKVYLSNSTDWTWISSTSDNDAHNVFVQFDNPGIYTLQISGRSKDHLIDRVILYKAGVANPTSLTNQETPCQDGGGDNPDGCTNSQTGSLGHDAYLQGTAATLINNTELRVESGNRIVYLQYDLSAITAPITSASLELSVGSDNGNGLIEVYKGTSNTWTETNLSATNRPAEGDLLGSLNTTYALGQKYTWPLTGINQGEVVTLILKQTGGNDVSFYSKEGSAPPKLNLNLNCTLSVGDTPTENIAFYPNPVKTYMIPKGIKNKKVSLYDISGKMIKSGISANNNEKINLSFLTPGVYFFKIEGLQKQTFKFIKTR